MGKITRETIVNSKSNWTQFNAKLPNKAWLALFQMEDETGKSRTAIVANLLLGKSILPPSLERVIMAESKKRNISWISTVSELLSEALAAEKMKAKGGKSSPLIGSGNKT